MAAIPSSSSSSSSLLSHFFFFFFLLCLIVVFVSSPAAARARKSSYIVSVDRTAKPHEFSSHETWYSSLIASAMAVSSTRTFLDTNEISDGGKSGDSIQIHSGTNSMLNDHILHVYDTVFHGFAAKLSEGEAMAIGSRPGVLAVFPDQVKHVHTTRTPAFLGLDVKGAGLWPKSDFGSDVIVGILDTGIWPESRSFNDAGLGPVPSRWKGACEVAKDFPTTLCNRKIVGARYFVRGNEALNGPINETIESRSARDTDGHGTHTASTVAGVYVENAGLFGYASGVAKGLAPKARIAAYKVCWATGCFDSDILAGFDRAVSDGVDVISLSIGGEISSLDIDTIAIGAFGAVAHGVFVSASGGNMGPSPASVTNLAPWVTTVGASTLDRTFPANVILGNNRTSLSGVSLYSGPALPHPTLFPLADARDLGFKLNAADPNSSTDDYESTSALCMNDSLNPALAKGKIVLCQRGGNTRTAKGAEVRRAGGVGMILMNSEMDGEGLVADSHVLPALTVGYSAGSAIGEYIATSRDPIASIMFRGTELGVKPAPIVASFSSRGPGQFVPEVLKPDIIAPGVNILAAWTPALSPSGLPDDPRKAEFNIISGTSMACPHVSGVAALLRSTHRDWSPAAVRSALMTTASMVDNRGFPIGDEASGEMASPFDLGSGHVFPEKAMDPGLVYDIEPQDYVDFLCALNYSLRSIHVITRIPPICHPIATTIGLNYPSFSAILDQHGSQEDRLEATFHRTLTNVGPSPFVTYNASVLAPHGVDLIVRPSTLVFTSVGQRVGFTLTVSGNRLPSLHIGDSASVFGSLVWTDSYAHNVRSPIAITWQQ